jgi:hypothetical protein
VAGKDDDDAVICVREAKQGDLFLVRVLRALRSSCQHQTSRVCSVKVLLLTLIILTSLATSNASDSNSKMKKVNVLMVGTGEYTTGYVGGKASDSDKGAGVVALTMFDLRRRDKVERLGMCGVNVS